LARTLAVARVQWKLALRPPPDMSQQDKIVLRALLVPLLAFVALALGFLGYMAGFKLSADMVYFHYLLVGLSAFLLFVTGISVPLADKSLSGFETSRLFHLPITPGEILASQVLGNALNPGIVLIPGAFVVGCAAGSLRAGLPALSFRCLLAGSLWLAQLGLLVMAGDYAVLYLRRRKALRRTAGLLAILILAGCAWLMHAFGRGTESKDAAQVLAPVKQDVLSLWEWGEPVIGYFPGISPVAWVAMRPGWWPS
jgi:hypothetical protein